MQAETTRSLLERIERSLRGLEETYETMNQNLTRFSAEVEQALALAHGQQELWPAGISALKPEFVQLGVFGGIQVDIEREASGEHVLWYGQQGMDICQGSYERLKEAFGVKRWSQDRANGER
jgi:hypothetical protein